ncbi:MAG: phosphoenolpyruvate--protein phosphotransferase [Phycisphaerales bacterium JB064]
MSAKAEHRFVCGLVNGLHARPASVLAEAASAFAASIAITRDDGTTADMRSVLSVVGLDVQQGEAFMISAEGVDATAAVDALRLVVETGLDDEEPVSSDGTECRLPPVLRMMGVEHAPGVGVCGGVGIGAAVCVGGLTLPAEAMRAVGTGVEAELREAGTALERVSRELTGRALVSQGTEAALLRAHAQIANDGALWKAIESRVREGATAARAVVGAAEEMAGRLRDAKSVYVRDRAVDVVDIAMQVIERLLPGAMEAARPVLERDSVVFADMLTANQLLGFDRRYLKGLVLGSVGRTSHTVILARGMGLPCVVEVANASSGARHGDEAVVDGGGGFAICPVDDGVRRYYERELATHERRRARVLPLVCKPAVTSDGVRLEVGVTAVDATEVGRAITHGADGVGLFRTEFLYLERDAAPGEDEQREVYARVIDAADGKPVILRTFDVGGDKPAPYLGLSREENPFLGVRGVRLYERRPELLRTQLRAMLRAADGRPVKIMAPMVATVAEMRWFRERVKEARAEVGGQPSIGMMLEVPSVALSIDRFAPHADFVSIGTNDLCQYWMAADRGNAGVAGLCDELQPVFLRAMRRIVDDAKRAGLWVGVCGEMGGRVANVPLMVGLGVDEVSAGPADVAGVKLAVGEADAARCRDLLEKACELNTTHQVRELVRTFAWRADRSAPGVIDAACIEVGVDAASKAEAIKAAVDLLSISGRTNGPRDVEEAVWAREATYSTGLGHGFAVPHCKSAAMRWPTLAVVKLTQPVDWDAMDGKPVHTVLLLAMPDGEAAGGGSAHLKIFATLARRLMHEGFRDGLQACTSTDAIERHLRAELGL